MPVLDHSRKKDSKHTALKYNYNDQVTPRTFDGSADAMSKGLLAVFSIFLIVLNIWKDISPIVGRCLFLGYVILLIFMLYPHEKSPNKGANYIPVYDLFAATVGSGSFLYYGLYQESLVIEGTLLGMDWNPPLFLGLFGLLALAESCRRVAGSSIVWITGVLFLYAISTGRPLTRIVYDLFYSELGVVGSAVSVCASHIVPFIIFGCFLESIGLNTYFLSCAKRIAGSSRGGAAKVAVISSALCGMMTGSSVGNTVSTGAKTIPMMKRNGYPSTFAAAVEAASSTGGQIMPPIMGSAAFLMAELHHFPYTDLMKRAILPAFFYFLGIYFMVHFTACRDNLSPLPQEDIPNDDELIKKSYILLPLVMLIFLMVWGVPLNHSVLYATLLCVVIGRFDKENPLTVSRLFQTLEQASKNSLPVAVACGMAGVISGIVVTTGLGQFLISAVVSVSGTHLLIALVVTMFFCLLLGLAVPTIANYVIMTTIFVPILTQGMGMDLIAANMFVFYFGIVADVTPPVSIASKAAAIIARASVYDTAVTASLFSIGGFVIPYFFAFHPILLNLDGNIAKMSLLIFSATLGMFIISTGIVGYMLQDMKIPTRILAVVSGLLLIVPESYSDVVGFVAISIIILGQWKKKT